MIKPLQRVLYAVIVMLLCITTGCVNPAKNLGAIEELVIERHGSVGVSLSLKIENRSSRNIKIKECVTEFCYKGIEIGSATLRGELSIPKRKESHIESLWRVSSNDPAAMQLLLSKLERGEWEDISLNIEMRAKAGIAGRRIKVNGVTIESLQSYFLK